MATESDTEDGLVRLRAVVRANPRSTAFVALAHALCDAGENQEAEAISRGGLAQHPDLVTGKVALGRALLAQARLREAQEELSGAARSHPEHGDAFRWLAEVILRRGHVDKAKALLEYAEELLPSDARVTELLVQAGGVPLPRVARPRTDFEDTRVGDAGRLAKQMLEDPPAAATPKGSPAVRGTKRTTTEDAITAEFDPRPVNGAAPSNSNVHAPARATVDRAAAAIASFATRSGHAIKRLWTTAQWPLRAAALGGFIAILVGLAWLGRPKPSSNEATSEPPVTKPIVAAVDMTAAIASGTLDGLSAVRALGKRMLEVPNANPDELAAAAFAASLLANDYGVAGTADAMDLAAAAGKAVPERAARTARLEATRALVAISSGRLPDADAAVVRGLAADAAGPEINFVAGRLWLRQGKLAEARASLGKAVAQAPALAAAALDLAQAAIDAGEAEAAATQLTGLLAGQDDLRARLLLNEADRLAGKPASSPNLKDRCRDDGRSSLILRTSCAADSALAARLVGDRAGAIRAARAASTGGGRNPRAMAQGALVLANLGEVEAAADALRKIRDDSGPGFLPRVFAQLALTLGKGEIPDAAAIFPVPNGPEARLLTARLAFARGGAGALGAYVKTLPPSALEQDPDLAALALLSEAPPVDPARLAPLTERADKGSGVASYVLGRLLLAGGDEKNAVPRLSRAVQSTGDACEAARLILSVDKKARPPALATDAKVIAFLRGHNGACVSPRR